MFLLTHFQDFQVEVLLAIQLACTFNEPMLVGLNRIMMQTQVTRISILRTANPVSCSESVCETLFISEDILYILLLLHFSVIRKYCGSCPNIHLYIRGLIDR